MLRRRALTHEARCATASLRFKGAAKTPPSPTDAVIPITPAAPVGTDASPLPPLHGTYAVDVSSRAGALCVCCGLPIPSATLRYAILVDGPGDFKIPRFSHAACFRTSLLRTYPGAFARLQAVDGLMSLPDDDIALTKVVRMAARDDRLALDLVLSAPKLAQWRAQRTMYAELVASLAANRAPVLRNFVINALESGGGTGTKNTPVPARFRTSNDKKSSKDLASVAADLICYGVPRGCDGCASGPVLPTRAPLQYRCRGYVDEYTACNDSRDAREAASRPTVSDLRSVHGIDVADVNGLAAFLKSKQDRLDVGAALDQGIAKLKRVSVDELHIAAAEADGVKANAFAGRVFVFESSKAAKSYRPKIEAAGGSVASAAQAAKVAVESTGPAIVVVSAPPESGGSPASAANEFLETSIRALQQEPIAATTQYIDACLSGNGRVLGPGEGKTTLFRLPQGLLRDQSSSLRIAKERGPSAEEKASAAGAGGSASVTIKDGVVVDSEYEHAATAVVLRDNATRDPLSVQLNNVDLTTGANSFYILQGLQVGSNFVLYRRWGRVGDDFRSGKTAKTFPTSGAAQLMFEKLFEERTGNTWGNRAAFKKVPGRYNYVHCDAADVPAPAAATASKTAKRAVEGAPTSPLAPATQSLLSFLFDKDVIQTTMATMEIDVEKMPLQNLSTKQLDEGNKALVELSDFLAPPAVGAAAKKKKKTLSAAGKRKRKTSQGEGLPVSAFSAADKKRLVSLTNRFYTNVPHALDASLPFEAHLIDTPDKVGAKSQLIQDLRDMIFTRTLINSDASSGGNASMALYKELNSDLAWVPRGSEDFELVDRYATNTQARTHRGYKVRNVWRIDRHGEDDRFRNNKVTTQNVQLLWHGSRLTNWVRILAQGLRIAPPEAPSTGYMFGKGIYFADMFSKSANYCHTHSSGDRGLLCLCEVALGNPEERTSSDYITHLPSGLHHSCFARGQTHPDPADCLTDWGNFHARVPLGRGRDNTAVRSSLLYNEFIVYDISQVRVRFLVEVDG